MITNLDSTAIASEENLQKNPTIQQLLKIEADASRKIAQQLADKKQECGKNKRKWQEYLQENGFTERDANKRIKLVRLPLVLWQVGTIMALQLVTPMMEPVRDYFTATGDKVTQEAVQAKMDDMKLMRKMERELLAEEEEVTVWKVDKNGRRYWESGKSYNQEAGVVLEELVKETGKLPQTIISEALLLMVDGGVSVSRPSGRWQNLVLLMFRHGLRVTEACEMRWDAISLLDKEIFITRKKGSDNGVHPLPADEVEALTKLWQCNSKNSYVFVGEREEPLTPAAVQRLLTRLGAAAGLNIKLYPHQLRHACGYYLVNAGYSTRFIQDF